MDIFRDQSNISHFPDELILQIFDHLSLHHRLVARKVCRQWRRLSLLEIDELQIGKKRVPDVILRKARYPLYILKFTTTCRTIKTISNYSGYSLRSLTLNFSTASISNFDLCRCTLDSLVSNCPNLVQLYLDIPTCLTTLNWSSFFGQLGHKLEKVFIFPTNVCLIAIPHLNPERLKEFGFHVHTPKECKQLFQKFPHLTSISLSSSTLSVSALKNLSNLKKLHLQGYLPKKVFLACLQLSNVQHLDSLLLETGELPVFGRIQKFDLFASSSDKSGK